MKNNLMSISHQSFNLSVPNVRAVKHDQAHLADSPKDYRHTARYHGVTAL